MALINNNPKNMDEKNKKVIVVAVIVIALIILGYILFTFARDVDVDLTESDARVRVQVGGVGMTVDVSGSGRNITAGDPTEAAILRTSPGDTVELTFRFTSNIPAPANTATLRVVSTPATPNVLSSGVKYVQGSTKVNGVSAADGIMESGLDITGFGVDITEVVYKVEINKEGWPVGSVILDMNSSIDVPGAEVSMTISENTRVIVTNERTQ